MRTLLLVICIAMLAHVCAHATPPLSSPTTEVWKRDLDGNVVFASAPDDRLEALCIEVAGQASWVPSELLRDIEFPNLEDIHFVRGMGLDASEHVPNWGNWGLSVSIETEVEVNGQFEAGPEYFFVVQDGRVVYRVLRTWVPSTKGRGIREQREEWLNIPQSQVRGGKCKPPMQSGERA